MARFFRNKVGDDAAELIQSTFLRCVERRDEFRRECSFRTFLFSVARNELYSYVRRRNRDDMRFDPLVVSIAAVCQSLSAVVAQRQDDRVLLEALRCLPLEHQLVLELFYWEDMTASEVSEVLAVPLGTAKTRIRRARKLLEAQLGDLLSAGTQLESTLVNLDVWARELRLRVTPGPRPAT